MNGVKAEIHVRVEQTARGIWYCSGADVYSEHIIGLKTDLDMLMCLVEEVLGLHNNKPVIEPQQVDLSTQKDAMKKAMKVKP